MKFIKTPIVKIASIPSRAAIAAIVRIVEIVGIDTIVPLIFAHPLTIKKCKKKL